MNTNPILILTGETGAGKTSLLNEIMDELDGTDINYGGILAPGKMLAGGEKEFELELLPSYEKYFLSTRIAYKDWMAIGKFHFNPAAVEAGLYHLRSMEAGTSDLVIIDEIGPFELDGSLWAPAIPGLVSSGKPMIWTVRRNLLEKVCEHWKIDDPVVVTKEAGKPLKPKEKIRNWIGENVKA